MERVSRHARRLSCTFWKFAACSSTKAECLLVSRDQRKLWCCWFLFYCSLLALRRLRQTGKNEKPAQRTTSL